MRLGHRRSSSTTNSRNGRGAPHPRERAHGGGCYITRVTGFLWDRGRDRLWRQGIDLIGDDRRRQGSESIEDGAMIGKSEGGEFLDVTDDGFDDIAPVEQGLVEERHR